MNANVYGPMSCRHNDLYALSKSELNNKLQQLQIGNAIQYKIYGDAAYMHLSLSHIEARHNNIDNTQREKLENKVMASCRQTIEFNYGDLKTKWAFLEYKNNLKLLDQPVFSMSLAAMILRNALVCMNGNQCSIFFDKMPPRMGCCGTSILSNSKHRSMRFFVRCHLI